MGGGATYRVFMLQLSRLVFYAQNEQCQAMKPTPLTAERVHLKAQHQANAVELKLRCPESQEQTDHRCIGLSGLVQLSPELRTQSSH